MKNKKFRLIIFLLFVLAGSAAIAAQEVQEPLNAILAVETDDFNNSVIHDIAIAIDYEVTCILSTSIMHKLCTQPTEVIKNGCNSLQNHFRWSIFMDESCNYCVLIAKPYNDTLLANAGFAQLVHVENDEMQSYFANNSFDKREINLADFRNLFSWPNVPKRFFLSGHGQDQAKIGGIPLQALGEFFNYLSILNTEFLYVDSCFAAGENLLALQKMSFGQLQFPIVLQATIDEITFSGPLDFKNFFNNLNIYLAEKKRNYYGGRPSSGLSIAQVIKPILGANPAALQLPSMHFPGVNSFFRAIKFDNGALITSLLAKQLVAQSSIEQHLMLKKPAGEPVVPIANTAKFVLMYPANCSTITFALGNPINYPRFISKIPGRAQHYLGTIASDSILYDDFIAESFLRPLHESSENGRLYYYYGKSPKAWFVEHVAFKKFKSDAASLEYVPALLSGLIVYKPMTKKVAALEAEDDDYHPVATILFKDNDAHKFYMAHEPLPLSAERCEFSWVPTTSTWYGVWVRYIYESTEASPDALYEASGGLEDKQYEHQAFNHFKQSVGIY